MSSQNRKDKHESSEETDETSKSSKEVNKVKASPEVYGADFEKGTFKLKSLNFVLIQSKRDVFYEIKEVIQSILNEVNKTIDFKRKEYNFYAGQTLGGIFNEPQIMFQSSNLTNQEDQSSKIVCHEEPKAKAYIDGSIGCVKILNADKNSSVCSKLSKNKNLANVGNRRMSKSGLVGYVRSPRNSIKLKAMESLNLSSIEEKKSNFSNSKSINISVGDFIKKDLEETTEGENNNITNTATLNDNKRKSISGDFFSLMRELSKPSKFTAIPTSHKDRDDDDHFINYLRYVKEDNESTGSNVFSFILNSLKPKESNKEAGKTKNIANYKLPKVDKLDEKEWMQGPNKAYEAVKNSEIKLLAKKEKRMSVFLVNKEQINKDTNEVKDKLVLMEKLKQERKFSKRDKKENLDLMKQLDMNEELNKTKGKGKSFIYKKGEYKNENEIVKFPSLNTSQSKELFHPNCIDESLVWLKGKEDQKEYEQRMNEFMTKNSEKCILRVNYKEKTDGVNQTKEKIISINIPEQLNNPRKSRMSRLSLLIAR